MGHSWSICSAAAAVHEGWSETHPVWATWPEADAWLHSPDTSDLSLIRIHVANRISSDWDFNLISVKLALSVTL